MIFLPMNQLLMKSTLYLLRMWILVWTTACCKPCIQLLRTKIFQCLEALYDWYKSNHVLPCGLLGTMLDIKKSSHEKLSKWLQAKSSAGLITVKDDKYKKEIMLFSANWVHPDYLSFKPEKRQEQKVDQPGDQSISENGSKKAFEVAEIYKPSVQVCDGEILQCFRSL